MAARKAKKGSKEERLLNAVLWEIESVTGSARDRRKSSRKTMLDYYECNPRGDEEEGRSQVISPDCRAMVDACMAQLVDMVSHDNLCQFEADGENDEDSAKLESKVCNNVVQERNQGPVELQDAITDALKLGDGVLKFFVEETEEEETQTFVDITDEVRIQLLQPQAPNEERDLSEENDKGETTLTVTTVNRDFVLKSVPAERFLYPLNHDGHDLADCHFHAEEMTRTRSQLVSEGFTKSVVYDLPAAEMDTNETSRKRNKGATSSVSRATEDQEEIEIHECFIWIDLEGSGRADLYRVYLAAKSEILEYEPVDYSPFVLGSALLTGQRLGGESLINIIIPVQDIKTALNRQWLDNVYSANNNRVIYDPARATEDDVLHPKAVGGIRARDPHNSVVPLPFSDVGPSILAALGYADKMRTELGGAALDMASADAQLVGETAHGIERQMGNRELHIAMMARNISETLLRPLFLLVHRTLRDWANVPISMKISGEWQQIDPASWPDRHRLNITTGDSMGVKRMKAQTLGLSLQMQQQAMASGMAGVLADAKTLYRTHTDILRLSGIDNPDRHSIDPDTPEAKQAAQINSQSAQQQQQTIDRLAALQAQGEQTKSRIDLLKLEQDGKQFNQDLAFKYAELEAELEKEEARLIGGATLELQRIQREARNKANATETDNGRTPQAETSSEGDR